MKVKKNNARIAILSNGAREYSTLRLKRRGCHDPSRSKIIKYKKLVMFQLTASDDYL